MQNMRQRALVSALAAVGLIASGSVFAQAAPAKVEKIEVTGSNIKRVDAETTAPIQVITQEEIRRSGRQTVTELLRELPINAAGGLTELTGSGSFSSGAATASLRGLGSTATLVLLNGRRIAPFGLADPNFGQSGVVNLNSIPLDVIERIEILKDGASAIYGSEAIAGVINIILRKDYKGGQVGGNVTMNNEGEYRTETAVASFGFGDLAKDRYNAFVNFEAFKSHNVLFKDVEKFLNRQQFRDVYGTGLISSAFSPFLTYVTDANGLANATPGAACPAQNRVPWNFNGFNLTGAAGASGTVCLYDNLSRQEIVPQSERQSVFARATVDVSPTTQVYAEGSFVKNSVYFLGFPQVVGFGTGATFNPSTGRLNPSATSLPVGHPNNPFGRNTFFRGRMDAVGNQDNEVKSETTRIVAGVKTTLGRFDVESGILFNKGEVEAFNYNALRYDRLMQGLGYAVVPNAVGNPTLVPNVAGGTYNFATPNSGGVTADQIRYNARDVSESKFTVFDVKMSGEIGTLPGGAASMALGAEYRRENRFVRPDAQKTVGNIFGRGVASVDGSRNVSTVYGELILPVLKNVEVQAAVRYDRYSDYGNSLTPKLAASWAPMSSLKLRGSFARGFRAPSLTEITRSSTSGFFNGVDDPRRCNRGLGITIGCGLSIPGLIVAFPGVQPEKAESYTGGFVWEVSQNTNLSVDYFSISRRNEITFLSLNEILLNEGSTNPLYQNRVTRDPANVSATVPNDPGAILFVSTSFANLGETRVKGVDLDLRHRISLGSMGRMTLNAVLTHYTDQRGSGAPGAPLISYSGFRNAPEWRGQFRGTWEVGSWTHTGAMNFVGPFKAFSNPEGNTAGANAVIRDCGNPVNSYLATCTVATYVTFDYGFEYRGFKGWRLNFTARNLANARPSLDPLARPFNLAWYQPQGLNFVLGARYSWN
ncbi:MAG: TonB-dependent receptor plug domain-containing protein [Burkholderiales bacterium]